MLSTIFMGSLALLASGGAHIATKSHYQRRLREMEQRLREAQDALAEREAELEMALAEIERLREKLADREGRLHELSSSIDALRDLTVDLDRRLGAHDGVAAKIIAAIKLRLDEHRRDGEEMRARLVETRRSLQAFCDNETGLQAEILEVRGELNESLLGAQEAEADVSRCRESVRDNETEIREAVGS